MKLFNHHLHSRASFDVTAPGQADTAAPGKPQQHQPAQQGKTAQPGQTAKPETRHPAHARGLHAGRRQRLFDAMFPFAATGRDLMSRENQYDTGDHSSSLHGTLSSLDGKELQHLPLQQTPTAAGRHMYNRAVTMADFCASGAGIDETSRHRPEQEVAKVVSQALNDIKRLLDPADASRPSAEQCAATLRLLVENRRHITQALALDHAHKKNSNWVTVDQRQAVERKLNAVIERLYMHAGVSEVQRGELFESRAIKTRREADDHAAAQLRTDCIRAMLDPHAIAAIPRHDNPNRSARLNYLLSIGRMLGELPAARRAELLPDVIECIQTLQMENPLGTSPLGGTARHLLGLAGYQAQKAMATIGLVAGLSAVLAQRVSAVVQDKPIPEESLSYAIKQQNPLDMEASLVARGQTRTEHKLHSHGLALLEQELTHFRTAMLAGRLTAAQWDQETARLMDSVKRFIATDLGPLLLSSKRIKLLESLMKVMPEEMRQEIGNAIHATRVELTPEQWRTLGVREGGNASQQQAASEKKQALTEQIRFRQAEAWKMLCGLHGDKGCEALHSAVWNKRAGDVEALLMTRHAPRRRDLLRPRKNELGLGSALRNDRYSIDPNRLDRNGKSALYYAVELGNVAVVKALLTSPDIDIGQRCQNARPMTGAWRISDWSRGETALETARFQLADPNLCGAERKNMEAIFAALEEKQQQDDKAGDGGTAQDPSRPDRSGQHGKPAGTPGNSMVGTLEHMTMAELFTEKDRIEKRLAVLENRQVRMRQSHRGIGDIDVDQAEILTLKSRGPQVDAAILKFLPEKT